MSETPQTADGPDIRGPDAPDFDLIVVGGGVNGSGVARDAALRGLRVALFEKDDFAIGATGNSSGMIHGGSRYLLHDASVTRMSCVDSGYIQRIAPHLLFRIPFLVPVPRAHAFAQRYLDLVEIFFQAYDRYQPLKHGKPSTRLTGEQVRRVEPGLTQDVVGAVSFDEWGIDPWRLVASNVVDAARHGAEVANHCAVEGLLRDAEGRVSGVRVRDARTGLTREVTARIVLSCVGAWAPWVAALGGARVRLRPGKGIHIVLDRRITNYAVIAQAVDGRQVFVFPHENTTWIGTTDDDYFGDPDDIPVLEDEVEYLLHGIQSVFPDIRRYGRIRTLAGLRPTLYKHGVYEDDLSRGHELVDHTADGAPGFLSLLGGKLASYRVMAEEATDKVVELLGRKEPCRSHKEALPGGESPVDVPALATRYDVPEMAIQRLGYRQGSLASRILREARRDRELVCRCELVTAAEIRHVIRNEWVADLIDLERRTRFGTGPCMGVRCALRAAQILAEELGLGPTDVRTMLSAYARHRWKVSAPVAAGPTLARLELLRALAHKGSN